VTVSGGDIGSIFGTENRLAGERVYHFREWWSVHQWSGCESPINLPALANRILSWLEQFSIIDSLSNCE
jgi:hypothetical protein